MTITNRQRQCYSVLASFLPVATSTMLLIASLAYKPYSVLELVSLGATFLLFLLVVGGMTAIREKVSPREDRGKILMINLGGPLLMLVLFFRPTAAGLFLDPICNALLSLVLGLLIALATTSSLMTLPSNTQPEPGCE